MEFKTQLFRALNDARSIYVAIAYKNDSVLSDGEDPHEYADRKINELTNIELIHLLCAADG